MKIVYLALLCVLLFAVADGNPIQIPEGVETNYTMPNTGVMYFSLATAPEHEPDQVYLFLAPTGNGDSSFFVDVCDNWPCTTWTRIHGGPNIYSQTRNSYGYFSDNAYYRVSGTAADTFRLRAWTAIPLQDGMGIQMLTKGADDDFIIEKSKRYMFDFIRCNTDTNADIKIELYSNANTVDLTGWKLSVDSRDATHSSNDAEFTGKLQYTKNELGSSQSHVPQMYFITLETPDTLPTLTNVSDVFIRASSNPVYKIDLNTVTEKKDIFTLYRCPEYFETNQKVETDKPVFVFSSYHMQNPHTYAAPLVSIGLGNDTPIDPYDRDHRHSALVEREEAIAYMNEWEFEAENLSITITTRKEDIWPNNDYMDLAYVVYATQDINLHNPDSTTLASMNKLNASNQFIETFGIPMSKANKPIPSTHTNAGDDITIAYAFTVFVETTGDNNEALLSLCGGSLADTETIPPQCNVTGRSAWSSESIVDNNKYLGEQIYIGPLDANYIHDGVYFTSVQRRQNVFQDTIRFYHHAAPVYELELNKSLSIVNIQQGDIVWFSVPSSALKTVGESEGIKLQAFAAGNVSMDIFASQKVYLPDYYNHTWMGTTYLDTNLITMDVFFKDGLSKASDLFFGVELVVGDANSVTVGVSEATVDTSLVEGDVTNITINKLREYDVTGIHGEYIDNEHIPTIAGFSIFADKDRLAAEHVEFDVVLTTDAAHKNVVATGHMSSTNAAVWVETDHTNSNLYLRLIPTQSTGTGLTNPIDMRVAFVGSVDVNTPMTDSVIKARGGNLLAYHIDMEAFHEYVFNMEINPDVTIDFNYVSCNKFVPVGLSGDFLTDNCVAGSTFRDRVEQVYSPNHHSFAIGRKFIVIEVPEIQETQTHLITARTQNYGMVEPADFTSFVVNDLTDLDKQYSIQIPLHFGEMMDFVFSISTDYSVSKDDPMKVTLRTQRDGKGQEIMSFNLDTPYETQYMVMSHDQVCVDVVCQKHEFFATIDLQPEHLNTRLHFLTGHHVYITDVESPIIALANETMYFKFVIPEQKMPENVQSMSLIFRPDIEEDKDDFWAPGKVIIAGSLKNPLPHIYVPVDCYSSEGGTQNCHFTDQLESGGISNEFYISLHGGNVLNNLDSADKGKLTGSISVLFNEQSPADLKYDTPVTVSGLNKGQSRYFAASASYNHSNIVVSPCKGGVTGYLATDLLSDKKIIHGKFEESGEGREAIFDFDQRHHSDAFYYVSLTSSQDSSKFQLFLGDDFSRPKPGLSGSMEAVPYSDNSDIFTVKFKPADVTLGDPEKIEYAVYALVESSDNWSPYTSCGMLGGGKIVSDIVHFKKEDTDLFITTNKPLYAKKGDKVWLNVIAFSGAAHSSSVAYVPYGITASTNSVPHGAPSSGGFGRFLMLVLAVAVVGGGIWFMSQRERYKRRGYTSLTSGSSAPGATFGSINESV